MHHIDSTTAIATTNFAKIISDAVIVEENFTCHLRCSDGSFAGFSATLETYHNRMCTFRVRECSFTEHYFLLLDHSDCFNLGPMKRYHDDHSLE